MFRLENLAIIKRRIHLAFLDFLKFFVEQGVKQYPLRGFFSCSRMGDINAAFRHGASARILSSVMP